MSVNDRSQLGRRKDRWASVGGEIIGTKSSKEEGSDASWGEALGGKAHLWEVCCGRGGKLSRGGE